MKKQIETEPITLQNMLAVMPRLFEVIANIYRADKNHLDSLDHHYLAREN